MGERAPTSIGFLLPGLLLITAFVSAGCGGGESPEGGGSVAVDTLPDGTRVVRNRPPPDRFEDGAWTISEDLRIGTVAGGGPAQFGNLRDVAVDGEGRIYALDTQAAEVRVFGPEGKHLRTLGGKGEGPGEFRAPNGLAIGPGQKLWIADPRLGRYTAYSLEGELAETHRVQFLSFGYTWDGTVDLEGRILDGRGLTYQPPGPRARFTRRFDWEEGAVDTLFLPEPPPEWSPEFFVFEGPGRKRMGRVPHTERHVYRYDRSGRVWSALTGHYRIVRQDLRGDTTLVVESEIEPIPVTEEEREAAEEDLAAGPEWATESDADPAMIPEEKAPLLDLAVDDRDRLWVRLVPEPGEPPRFDVYDPDGRWVAAARAEFGFSPHFSPVVRGGHLYGIAEDSLEVRYVVRGEIRKP